MKIFRTWRAWFANSARRSALALVDRSLALMTLVSPSPKLKICLTALHVLTKVLLWVAAWDDVKSKSDENKDDEAKPP